MLWCFWPPDHHVIILVAHKPRWRYWMLKEPPKALGLAGHPVWAEPIPEAGTTPTRHEPPANRWDFRKPRQAGCWAGSSAGLRVLTEAGSRHTGCQRTCGEDGAEVIYLYCWRRTAPRTALYRRPDTRNATDQPASLYAPLFFTDIVGFHCSDPSQTNFRVIWCRVDSFYTKRWKIISHGNKEPVWSCWAHWSPGVTLDQGALIQPFPGAGSCCAWIDKQGITFQIDAEADFVEFIINP